MIDLKSAVGRATQFMQEVYDMEMVKNILLEEIETSKDGKYWLITIGFNHPTEPNVISLMGTRERHYKLFEIDKVTGEVASMKIRTL